MIFLLGCANEMVYMDLDSDGFKLLQYGIKHVLLLSLRSIKCDLGNVIHHSFAGYVNPLLSNE